MKNELNCLPAARSFQGVTSWRARCFQFYEARHVSNIVISLITFVIAFSKVFSRIREKKEKLVAGEGQKSDPRLRERGFPATCRSLPVRR